MKNEKKPSFMKSVSIVVIISIIGKILGFIKQIILASYFGANEQTDLFFTSYFFVIEIATAFFSALGVVFLSAYAKGKKNGEKFVNNLFSSTLIFFTFLALILSILLFCFPHLLINIIAPGYSNTLKEELSLYLQILSPLMILYCMQYIYNSILEYEKKFLPTKTLTIILNISLITFTYLFSKKYGTIVLIFAVLIAHIVQSLFSYLYSRKYIKFKIINPFKNIEFKKMLYIYMPLFVSNAITEINSIIDRSVASTLNNGAVSSITYAASINEIVTVLIIGTIGSVFYSYITAMVNSENKNKIMQYLKKTLKVLLIILIPINILFLHCAKDIVELIYMRGNFDAISVKNTALVVVGYAIGFIPLMIRTTLIKVHYAYDDTKNPMINGLFTVFINIVFSILLTQNIGIVGIPIATSISFIVSMILCCITVKKHINILLSRENYIFLGKLFIISIILTLNTIIIKNNFNYNTLINLTIIGIFTIVLYILLLNLFKLYNFKDLINNVRKNK